MTENVLDFVKWGLKRVKKNSVPSGAQLPISISEVGSEGEWEYLYGTTGRAVTQYLLDERYTNYYSKHGWSKEAYNKATSGWVKNKRVACDCQGVLDAYLHCDINANMNYKDWCTDKGKCSSIDRKYVIGEAVFNGSDSNKTHVGWVCGFMPDGDVLVMEERGLQYGFVITQMSKRSWRYRGLMTKKFSYATDPVTNYIFRRSLKYGLSGDDVKELKKLLIAKGYGEAGWAKITATNQNFLGATSAIVRKYQEDNGLEVDGIAGPATIGSLGGKFERYVFHRSLKYGTVGEDVANLKHLLVLAGFGKDVITVFNENFYGQTRNVVKQFQASKGLAVDGIAGPKTIKELGGIYD